MWARSPPPHPSPASGGGSRPSLRIALIPLHLNTPQYRHVSAAHSVGPLSRLRGRDREGAGTKIDRAGRPLPTPSPQAGEGADRVCRSSGDAEHRLGLCALHCPLLYYTASISMAPPWPPPMHSVAMPWRTPSRFI